MLAKSKLFIELCHRHGHALTLVAILLLGLWLRVGFCLGVDIVPHSDMASFDGRGMAIWQHGTFNVNGDTLGYDASTYRPPLYPLLLAGSYAVFGHHYLPVYLIQAVLGTVFLGAVYGLGRIIARPKIALLATFCCSVYPPLVGYCGILLSETLFFVLMVIAVALLFAGFREQSKSNRWFVLSGIAFGLAGLARPVGLLLGLFLLIAAGLFKHFNKEDCPYRIRQLVITFIVAIVTVSPWTFRNALEFHRFVLVETATGINLFIGNNDRAKGSFVPTYDQLPSYQRAMAKSHNIVEVDEHLKQAALAWIKANPPRYGQLVLKRLGNYFVVEDEFYADKYQWSRIPGYSEQISKYARIVFQCLAMITFLWAVYRRNWRWLCLGIAAIFFYLMPSLVMFHTRYRHPALPFVFLLGAQGLELMIAWLIVMCRTHLKPHGRLHDSTNPC